MVTKAIENRSLKGSKDGKNVVLMLKLKCLKIASIESPLKVPALV